MAISGDIYNAFAPKVTSPQEVTNGLMQQAAIGQGMQGRAFDLQERRAALANAPALQARAEAEHAAKLEKMKAETAHQLASADKEGAQKKKLTLEAAALGAQQLAQGMRSIDPNDNAQIGALYERAHNEYGMSLKGINAEIAAVPKAGTPERLAWHAKQVAMGQSFADEMRQKLEEKKAEEQARAHRATEAEAQRTHKVTEGISGAAESRQASAPKGQIVQTDQGPMLVDPRDPGSAKPITTSDGTPLGPKLKDAPAAVQKAMIENGTNLRRAERALALVQGKNVGGAKGDTAATGWKGYLPNQILNRVDGEGVETRAAVADLGSLVIHDRSGAAVSASEFPRLAPFIPSEKDDAATVKKKLEHFVRVYKDEMAATEQAYGPDSGYRQISGPKTTAKTVTRTGTLNGKKVVQYSDGTTSYAD